VGDEGYLLDNQQAEAAERLDALSALFDPWSRAHLSALGLTAGWRVWEVGAGGPGMPSWLAAQVGPSGHVLATDLDPAWLPSTRGFEVARHDIGVDPAPAGGFDLVHARLLLVHVAQRDHALLTMVDALRPGGWLVVEDADPALQPLVCPDERGPDEQRANRLKTGFRELLAARGVELAFGRTLPRRLREAGLTDVAAEGYFPVSGPACTELERTTTEQLRARYLAAGLATDAEIDAHLAAVSAGGLDLATSPLITAWGRRPA
jgi:SAM-dependent methyltransferase